MTQSMKYVTLLCKCRFGKLLDFISEGIIFYIIEAIKRLISDAIIIIIIIIYFPTAIIFNIDFGNITMYLLDNEENH